MADSQQLALIRQGPKKWNQWRETNPLTNPDLSEAKLSEARLRGANLSKVDLSEADLSGATSARQNSAGRTSVGRISVGRSSARRTSVGGAHLTGANLNRANLSGADLREADLGRADLSWADLHQADLRGAHFAGTLFINRKLVDVMGLEACSHHGPSTMDYRTLVQSGQLPLPFLRGCGLPDKLIDYLPSLLSQAIQFFSCFISYSTKDEEFANRLHADLQDKGVRCWFAPEDLKIGDKFRSRIDESIRIFDKLLLVLTEDSIASSWVEEEVEAALEKESRDNKAVLFPIRLDDAVMETNVAWAASLRRTRHIGDFQKWRNHDDYSKAFERLMRDLKSEGVAPGR